jgi:hypothetical protein
MNNPEIKPIHGGEDLFFGLIPASKEDDSKDFGDISTTIGLDRREPGSVSP